MAMATDTDPRRLAFPESDRHMREAVLAGLGPHADRSRLRRGQTLPLAAGGEDTVFLVGSGALLLTLSLPGSHRQALEIFLPGDIARTSFTPMAAGAALIATAPSEVWRLRATLVDDLAAADARLRTILLQTAALQAARRAIHLTAVARLDAEQRVVTALIDLALRCGEVPPRAGFMLEMPFSRADLADYLGINPDTISRIMSRLRRAGVIGQSSRSRIILRDPRGLAANSPASRALAEIYADRPGSTSPREALRPAGN
jgi:CRP/FNR family transcriptional regulator